MFKNKLILSFVLLLLLPATNRAEEAKEGLKKLIESCLKHNPELKGTYHRWQAGRKAIVHKTALADPQVNFRHNLEPVQTRTGEQNQVLTISQALPYPGRQKTAIKLHHLLSENDRFHYEIKLRDLISEIKKTWAEVYFLSAATRLTLEQQKIIKLIGDNINSIQTGASLLPVIKVQSQQAQNANDLIRFSELLQTQTDKLRELSGSEIFHKSWFNSLPKHYLPASSTEIFATTFKQRVEILAAENQQKVADTGLKLARFADKPDFAIGFSQSFTGSRPDLNGAFLKGEGTDAKGVFVQMNLPIWQGKNRSRIDEAREKKLEAEANIEAERSKARAKLSELWFNLANRQRLLQIYEDTIIPQARTALETANSVFLQNPEKFADYLETSNTFYSLQIAALRAETDLFISATELEKYSGMPFDLIERGEQP
jgi:outer membrane protein TolC